VKKNVENKRSLNTERPSPRTEDKRLSRGGTWVLISPPKVGKMKGFQKRGQTDREEHCRGRTRRRPFIRTVLLRRDEKKKSGIEGKQKLIGNSKFSVRERQAIYTAEGKH